MYTRTKNEPLKVKTVKMVVYASPASSIVFFPIPGNTTSYSSRVKTPRAQIIPFARVDLLSDNSSPARVKESPKRSNGEQFAPDSTSCSGTSCFCTRRRFPIRPSKASNLPPDYTALLKKIRPPRPEWYEEFYAWVTDRAMNAYEAEIAGFKSQLFSNLKGKSQKVLEIGIGTGPNLKYYADDTDVQVFGMDPNGKMERYARAAAVAAGLPPANFEFIQAVGEVIPLSDASVDAVVGTLVLCSVKDVDMTLKEVKRVLKPGGLYLFVEHVAAKDGTILRLVQTVLDPLQQRVADGCYLTRETGRQISEAGFSDVDLNMAFLSSAFYTNPQVYGIARK